ncbi:MAG: UDP-glucose/GDP-mannose dehydrogenase family protein [Firmicutes bacterium]|nr:UDP-glucose/GDP-mannose dehydrogenase family protein [Bacillota bacterium]
MEIVVIGLGYVGLVNAVVLAGYHHKVTGYDLNVSKIARLKQGEAVLSEPGLQELLNKNKENLIFTDSAETAIKDKEVAFVAVDTPENPDGSANLVHFYAALHQIAKFATRPMSVIIRSTVPVGTNRLAAAYLKEESPLAFNVISQPEFLSQGRAVKDMKKPYRIILGVAEGETKKTVKALYAFYTKKHVPVLYTSPESAELAKYASNNFLALKISYINEMARLAEKVGADIDEVATGMGLDPRIGKAFFKAGIGYGGSCFPKDTKALNWLADKKHTPSETLKATIKVNQEQPKLFVDKINQRFHGVLTGKKIAVLGLAFKGNTTDVRNSPAYPIIERLLSYGAEVVAYDKSAIEEFKKNIDANEHLTYSNQLLSAMKGVQAVVIANDAKEIKTLKPSDFIDAMDKPIVYDGRNLYKPLAMAKIEYHSVGRPSSR